MSSVAFRERSTALQRVSGASQRSRAAQGSVQEYCCIEVAIFSRRDSGERTGEWESVGETGRGPRAVSR